jgi:drug/metabolite transporter (DMT)-like permease
MNYLMLLSVTAIWGLGFIATKWTFTDYSALWSNSLRFIFAGLIALPFLAYYKSYRIPLKKQWGAILCSILLMASMLLQTWGLVYTTTAKSGFITALYSLIIPLLGMIIYKSRYSIYFWALVFQSLVGIALLCNLDLNQFGFGDFLTLLCAFGFALHFMAIDKVTRWFPSAIELNALQCFWVGVFSLPLALFFEGMPNLAPLMDISSIWVASPLLGFICLSVFSSFIAFGVLAHVQKFIPSHSVGMICLLESPFAALFGYMFLKEELSGVNLVGCFVVLISVALIPFTEKKNWKRLLLALRLRKDELI